jgi:glutamine synthetase adenylyltransferase
MERNESDTLKAAYRTYREVEKLLRITLEETGSMLPEGQKLDTLARCLGRVQGAALKDELRETMMTTRKLFLAIGRRIGS